MKRLSVLFLIPLFFWGCSSVPDKVWNPVCTNTQQDISAFKLEEHFCEVGNDGWKTKCSRERREGYETVVRVAYLEYPNETLAGQAPVRDACQLQTILNAVNNQGIGEAKKKPLLISAYVHGWKHNASESDGNRLAYPNMLARYSSALKRLKKEEFDVLGIYVGWRGQSSKWPLSIGDRAMAADKLGRESALKQELWDVAEAMRAAHKDSRMIVMGHSLGGRVLSRAFLDDLEIGRPQPLGERVIITTVNAAIGADAYRDLYKPGKIFDVAHVPTWINFTAKEDGATNSSYEHGLRLGILSPDLGDGRADTKKTIGHYEDYLTHQLAVHYCGDDGSACGDVSELNAREYTDYWSARDYRLFTINYKVSNQGGGRYCVLMASYPLSVDVNARMASDRKGACKGVFESDPDYESAGHVRKIPAYGRLWNVRVDKSLLFSTERGWFGEWIFSTGTHNGYVQTSLANMLLRLVFDDEVSQRL